MNTPDTTPVVVGVGQHCPAAFDAATPASPYDLAAEAARTALADSGRPQELARALDELAFMRLFIDIGGFGKPVFGRSARPARSIAARLGIEPPQTVYSPVGGNVPQKMINDYADLIARGELGAVLLCGAEAQRTSAEAQRLGLQLDWNEDPPGSTIDDASGGDLVSPHEFAHGIGLATWSYPLFEHAIRGARGASLAAHMSSMGRLFERLNVVAARNPRAAFGAPRSAAEIATPSDRNRIICHPYTRWMNASDRVDEAAAVILAPAGLARRLGIDPSRWIYVRGCGDASAKQYTLEQPTFCSSPSLAMAARAALEMSALTLADIDCFDLYSCFPSAVELACQALGLAEDDPRGLTVTGGLPFFGGPGNAYVLHAVAETVARLRTGGARHALVEGNGGLMSKQSVGIYSRDPPVGRWRREAPASYQRVLDAEPAAAVTEAPQGKARVETYTVICERGEPVRGVVVGRLLDGDARFVANTPADRPQLLRWMMEGEPLRSIGEVTSAGGRNTFVPDSLPAA